MKIALAQMKMSAIVRRNVKTTTQLIRAAASRRADLICFPEIQLSPFFPQYEKRDVSAYALREDSPEITEIRDVCREARIHAAGNFYLEYGGKRYDTSLLIDDEGRIIGRQKMVHIAQCPCFYEQDYYTPSDEGFAVMDTKLGRIGIVVCFDRHYPESMRTLVLRGADLILIPTANTTDEPSELFQWEIKIQSFHNSVFAAMVNRVGQEGEMVFCGESIVTGPDGETLALAGAGEELLLCEVEPAHAAARRAQKPYTALRRPELYE